MSANRHRLTVAERSDEVVEQPFAFPIDKDLKAEFVQECAGLGRGSRG